MLTGVTLLKSANSYYCPGFTRAGQKVAVTVEALTLSAPGDATLDIDIEHKNFGDTSWTTAASFTQFIAESVQTKEVSSPKEMLRLKYTVGGASASDFAHFSVYPVVWRG
jgi:hypothetical protein